MDFSAKRIHNDQLFCKHRPSIVKRWTEDGNFYAIIRCRWCDRPWERKVIKLKQDDRGATFDLLTQKALDQGFTPDKSLSKTEIPETKKIWNIINVIGSFYLIYSTSRYESFEVKRPMTAFEHFLGMTVLEWQGRFWLLNPRLAKSNRQVTPPPGEGTFPLPRDCNYSPQEKLSQKPHEA